VSIEKLDFTGRVAIVTGAGAGLGRSHALELARRGAHVVVNDLGGDVAGTGSSNNVAMGVVDEIRKAGGSAIAHGANVTKADEVEDMVSTALKEWDRVDILVNNAGILRDKSFAKMTIDDFRAVIDVHLMGAVYCCKAVWDTMRERQYGRIVMTSSASGLYGNFGQSNYGAAKAGLMGLMNVLSIEGASKNIHVNALAPTAFTRMTEGIVMGDASALLTPETVTPALIYLVSEVAPNKTILSAGAGVYSATKIHETQGIYLPLEKQTAENVTADMDQILDMTDAIEMENVTAQILRFVSIASANN